jgi:DNA-binding transcriptional MerR regulator
VRSLQTLDEKQATMRDRVHHRPCKDGRSRKARGARARLIKLEDVVPRTQDYVVKRRAARFMLSRNFSPAYIANQLGMSLPDLEEMLRQDEPKCEPGERARALLREQEREKRREAKDPLAKLWKPENEVTFVTAFGGEVKALTESEEVARHAALAEIRQRELRDADARDAARGRRK